MCEAGSERPATPKVGESERRWDSNVLLAVDSSQVGAVTERIDVK